MRYTVSAVGSLALGLTVLMVLVYTFRPDVAAPLQRLSQWVWAYLLVDPALYLPNTSELSIEERRHLLDVKRVLNPVHWVWWLSSAMGLLACIIIGFGRGWQAVKPIIRSSAWWVLGITVLAGLLALMDFSGSFHQLHSLFFKADTWIFPKNSTIIQLFPFVYFQTFAVYWGGLNVVLAGILLFLTRR